MKRRIALLAAFAFFFAPSLAVTCAFYPGQALFVAITQPDVPDAQFLSGKLGIVKPTWRTRYRVIAFRNLNDQPLTAAERTSLRQSGEFEVQAPVGAYHDPDAALDAAIKDWMAVRQKVAAAPDKAPDPNYYHQEAYVSVPNCHADAFNAAASRL